MNKRFQCGMNIAEVLISLGLFSTAMVGLYMGINSMTLAMGDAMARDIEAAYANMLIAEVNPFRWKAEEDYDTATSPRASLSLPDGRTIYYTRLVDSAPTSRDVLRINIYLYHTPTGGSPYRQFRRETIIPYTYISFTTNAKVASTPNWRDRTGRIWANGGSSAVTHWDPTLGDGQWGFKHTLTSGAAGSGLQTRVLATPAVSPVVDSEPWEYCIYPTPSPYEMGWSFSVTSNTNYKVELGFSEIGGAAVGARAMDVKINDVVVDTVDPRSETGGTSKPLVKSYTTTPTLYAGTTPVINIQLVKAAGATKEPMVCWIGITRQ